MVVRFFVVIGAERFVVSVSTNAQVTHIVYDIDEVEFYILLQGSAVVPMYVCWRVGMLLYVLAAIVTSSIKL